MFKLNNSNFFINIKIESVEFVGERKKGMGKDFWAAEMIPCCVVSIVCRWIASHCPMPHLVMLDIIFHDFKLWTHRYFYLIILIILILSLIHLLT